MADTAQAVFTWAQQKTDQIVYTAQPANEWLDLRVIPAYYAAFSAAVLAIYTIKKRVDVFRRDDEARALVDAATQRRKAGGFVMAHGSLTIVAFKVVRLVACGTTLGAAAVLFVHGKDSTCGGLWMRSGDVRTPFVVRLATVLTAAYTTFLAAISLAPALAGRVILSTQLTLTLLVAGAVYTLRDLWPYATFDLAPMDLAYGPLLWILTVPLLVAGVLVPVFIPRKYTPVDPLDPSPVPAPEQTASLYDLSTFSFLTPLINKGSAEHLPVEDLPPLADYDSARVLRSTAFPYIDPRTMGRKGYIAWGVLRYFAFPFFVQALAIWGLGIAEILAPIAMNRLLAYLETGGEGAVVRPWFWILCLFFGPLGVDLTKEWYNYIGNRNGVRLSAIMTQLVFEHALRIRIKAETSEKEPPAAHEASIEDEPEAETTSTLNETVTPPSEAGDADAATEIETATAVSVEPSTSASDAKKDAASKGGKKAQDVQATKKEDGKAKGKGKNLVGRINNLITTDLQQIGGARNFFYGLVYAPLEIVLDVIALYFLLGWASIVGLVVMIALIPVPTQFTKLFHGIQKNAMKATDARVQTSTEILSMLRMVKFFAWENHVEKRIDEKREAEMVLVWKRRLTMTFMFIVNRVIPLVHMVVTYWVYTAIMKQELKASIVFSSMTFFDLIRDQFFNCMYTIPPLVQAKVSFDRVNEFLYDTELLDAYTEDKYNEETRLLMDTTSHTADIGFGAVHFTWSAVAPPTSTSNDTDRNGTGSGAVTPSRQEYKLRIDEHVFFHKGGINLIVGPTGSGKTSMLMALLGEMHSIPSVSGAWMYLPREGGVAYAAQESWVQNETIRDNIVFGAPFDELRYKKVIYQCALQRDLELFDAGDRTEVGERGLTLSGGQKARITLARAIYSSAEIILLDDILAALDVHTSRWIVEKCLKGDLVRGRTVILVTHNVALTTPIADFVITLGTDGRIRSRGSVKHALAHDSTFRKEVDAEKKLLQKMDEADAIDEEFDVAAIDTQGASKSGKLVVEEEVKVGRMNWQSARLLTHAMSGRWFYLYWLVFGTLLAISQTLGPAQIWWLGQWANAYEGTDGTVNLSYYLGIYLSLIVLGVVFYAAANVQHAVGSIRASKYIHQQLIHSVLRTTLRWLDSTPTSRIVTRCTEDIDAVDRGVTTLFMMMMEQGGSMIIKFIAILIFAPIFIFPGILMGVIGVWLAHRYMRVQLPIKREMSKAKAPVVGHFGAAIAGIVSIRAYGVQEAFRVESMRRIDVSTHTSRYFSNVGRWVGVRVDLLSCLFTAALAAYMIYSVGATNASKVGFSINMAIAFSSMILTAVRIVNEFEIQGNSLERIQQYLVVDHEPDATPEGTPPAYWPASGKLEVKGLSARYSDDGPKVLQDISFTVESGSRIGIVGRTGSGKSSLTLSLLRTIFTDGEVYFDEVPTSKINLDALRSNITIIPQVPELLSGTLRHNLDPFGEHEDAALNDVLRNSGLNSIQSDTDEVRLTLDTQIASGGGNLSVGQKQILALARAMLRQTKILILDEATSAIDYETDALIQKSLRDEFKDVTLITVAHRLQTIMDADKIMVLDAGHLVEYDAPIKLLENKSGLLYSLVHESSDRDVLISMAKAKANGTSTT